MRTVLVAAALATVAVASPASAQQVGEFAEVRLQGDEGVAFQIDDRWYSGELRLRSLADGLSLVEIVPLDGYLAGVREVPATWPQQALDAQAVAARTYLAWTLDRGRSASGSRYDYDICATTQCQVYAGTGAGEPRWVDAVARTANEILLYEGRPAQTLYFSTSGGHTEPIQDIFAGASPRPYLTGVPSPGESSPYVTWSVTVPIPAFVSVLTEAGYAVGEVLDTRVSATGRGSGVWHLEIESSQGVLRIPVAEVRRAFNVIGPDRYPELLPGRRPDGRRYPQAILSYRFDAQLVPSEVLDSSLGGIPVDDRPLAGSVIFTGSGWGHHVGMSQYGALAMAESGSDYAAILGHFYGGLAPQRAPEALPESVAVGLDWGVSAYVVRADGPFTIVGDGRVVVVPEGGTWIFKDAGGLMSVVSGDLLLDRLLGRISAVSPVL